jgi:putative flippase GtrA
MGMAIATVAVAPPPRVRLRIPPMLIQLGRYALVGGVGTALNVVLFLIARLSLAAVPANVVAIVLSTLLTTEVNRRFTFHGARGRHPWRTILQNVGTMVFYGFYGSAVLFLLDAVVNSPTALMESVAVAVASVLGGLARFGVMRLWEFAPAAEAQATPAVYGAAPPGGGRAA